MRHQVGICAAAGPAALPLVFVAAWAASPRLKEPYCNWSSYAGSSDNAQYSVFRKIEKRNVSKLKLEWFRPIGPGDRSGFNPLTWTESCICRAKRTGFSRTTPLRGKRSGPTRRRARVLGSH
jgi:hypothetical protein